MRALSRNGPGRLVQDANATAGAFGHFDTEQSRTFVLAARANRPDLAGRQRVGADAVLALQLRSRDELFHPVQADHVAELRVAKLGRANALLLLLHATANFQGEAYCPFQIVVRHGDGRIGMEKLQQAGDGLIDRILIAAGKGAAEMHAPLEHVDAALRAKAREALRENVADEAEAVGEQLLAYLGYVPSRQVAVDAVHEGRVVPHLGRHRSEQVPHSLLVLHVHIEIADHDDTAFGADALPAA